MKYQLNLFFLALGFLSRVPVPDKVDYSPQNLNRCSRYFTLVGWLLGAAVAMVYATAATLFPDTISLWLTMAFSLLLTGAFHEDGLADTADGLGGAFARANKLTIMKDSRIGTYGAAALVMALLGKYLLLIENEQILLGIIIAYPVSRALAASLIADMNYVNGDDASKSKPIASHMQKKDLAILLVTALPAFLLLPADSAATLIGLLVIVRMLAKKYLNHQLGGYTGDCLGAVQQVTELIIYGALLAL